MTALPVLPQDTLSAAGGGTERASYIRGAAGASEVSGRRITVVALVLVALCLAALAAVFAAQAARDNAVAERLHRDGVTVPFTVTSCLGLASGTGITAAGFTCQGTFPLDGHAYRATLGTTTGLHHPGDLLVAVADPAHPTTVSLPSGAALRPAYLAYLPAMITAAFLVAIATLAFALGRRRAR